jgi:hypothetical protein
MFFVKRSINRYKKFYQGVIFIYTPVPMKRSMKYGSNYWTGQSFKLNREVCFNSDLEYDHWLLVETDPEIITFCEQPLKIQQIVDGEFRHSVFDMWVKKKNGEEEFREIKYSSCLEPGNSKYEETMRQITTQKEWCKVNNFPHRVLTEKELRKNRVLLENRRLMVPCLRDFKYCKKEEIEMVLSIVKSGINRIGEIKASLSNISSYKVFTCLMYLIHMEKVLADIDHIPIKDNMEVWVNG